MGLKRVGWGLFTATVAVFAPFGGATIVLVPSRLEQLDAPHKITLLAILTAAAAIVSFPASVIVGAVSDRTRSRLGRRNGWILGGMLVCAASTALMATADSVLVLTAGFLTLNAALSATAAATLAIIPDRVPDERKGTASAAQGAGLLLGMTLGALVAAPFTVTVWPGFLALAVIPLVLLPVFQLLAPDESSLDLPPAGKGLDLRATFTFPRRAPDYYWAFSARLLVIFGFYVVNGFQLFILTDYVGMTKAESAAIIGSAAIINLVGSLLGVVLGGPLSDRLGRRKLVTAIAAIIIGFGNLFPILAAEPWAILISTGISGVGLGMFFSVDAALQAQVLPSEETRGRDLGLLSLANNAGQVAGPLVGASIVGAGLGFSPVFIVAFAGCLVGAVLLRPIRSVQ